MKIALSESHVRRDIENMSGVATPLIYQVGAGGVSGFIAGYALRLFV